MELNLTEQYWVWLSSVEGMTPKLFYQLLSIYEDAQVLWDNIGDENLKLLPPAVLSRLKKARDRAYFDDLFDGLEKSGIRPVTRISDEYPDLLTEIYDPPATLFVLGECELRTEKGFSIVGSRRCTRDGQRAAREFAEGLAREDVTVISGLARGIDTAAHEGALIGMGKTIAVLGCGTDVIYPPENDLLYHRILDNGGSVISEYPPGTNPYPRNFPARNRIISGMSRGTMIVEGAEKSGAMITVNTALEQGRDVFAVPGSIYSVQSAAPNRLIVEGATPVLTHWQILEHYGWAERPGDAGEAPHAKLVLEPIDDQIVRPLLEQELSFDEIAGIVDFPVSVLNSHLTMLELRGIIVKVPGGLYRAYLS